MDKNISKACFCEAMSNIASHVHIATTSGRAGDFGLTVTSVCSVSTEPPTILVCVNQSTPSHVALKENGYLAINTLSKEQIDAAKDFAGMTDLSMEARFENGAWEKSPELKQPVLKGAMNKLVGRIVNAVESGTHTVFFVEIEEVVECCLEAPLAERQAGQDPLLYLSRSFRSINYQA